MNTGPDRNKYIKELYKDYMKDVDPKDKDARAAKMKKVYDEIDLAEAEAEQASSDGKEGQSPIAVTKSVVDHMATVVSLIRLFPLHFLTVLC